MASSTPAHPPPPGRSPPPDALPPIVDNGPSTPAAPSQSQKRTSLGFLRRSKSTEPLGERKTSGRMSRKQKEQAKEEELRRRREAAVVPKYAPRLPDLPPPPQLHTFGGDDARPDSVAIVSNRLGPYQFPSATQLGTFGPSVARSSDYVDPYARTESMTHRGRYSYASSAVSTINSPRRVRRRKDPTPYNILVIGARNSGKTSFLNFLRTSLALPPGKRPTLSPEELAEINQTSSGNGNFTSHYLETEIDNERVGVTLWDSEGLEKNMVDLQLREITSFLESKFEETFAEEMKVVRSPGVRDTHIHCVFLILDPVRLDANIAASKKAANGVADKSSASRVVGGLDEDLDLQVLRTMMGKTTVVPIISKADTVTTAHMAYLKKTVWESLKKANINPLESLTLEDQDDTSSGSLDTFDEKEEDELLKEKEEQNKEAEPSGDATPESEDASSESEEAKLSSPPRSVGHTKQKSMSSLSTMSANSESPIIPLSILSPDPHALESGEEPVGRRFPWGFADPYNPEHCDFLKLKESVFGEWRADLREASREVWYERWRTSRLNYSSSRLAARNGARDSASRSGRATR
ncbi:hypothetical protein VTO42DRAFT_1686 [Malbranchea cinnamomea]